jgi:SAM-dependent methyltransferase
VAAFHICKTAFSRANGPRVIAKNLHPGAVEHYEDAPSYERRYEARSEDVDFYKRRAKGKSVLEYGAGAGRLTLPLARAGSEILAVDVSEPMLGLLRKRVAEEAEKTRQRITIKKGDMRTFSTKRRFDLVIAGFHTLCHLYSNDDISAFSKRAFHHLKPGGALEFDLPLPRIDVPGYDPLAQVRVTEVDGESGPQLLTQRWYQPQEICLHLHYAGFERIRLGADFSFAKLQPESSIFVVSASKPG